MTEEEISNAAISIREHLRALSAQQPKMANLCESVIRFSDEELVVRVLLARLTRVEGIENLHVIADPGRPIEVTQHSGGEDDTFLFVSAVGTPPQGTILVHFKTGRISSAFTFYRRFGELAVTEELELFVEAVRWARAPAIRKNGSGKRGDRIQDFCGDYIRRA